MIKAQGDLSFLVKCVILGICICFALLGFSTVFIGDQSIYAWQRSQDLLAGINKEIRGIDRKNAALSTEIRLLKNDPSYLEKIIRQQLNYVKGSEVIYIFEDDRINSYWAEASTHEVSTHE